MSHKQSLTLECALAYIKLGWKVLPLYSVDQNGRCMCGKVNCGSAGKHPHGKLAPHGVKNATLDESVVKNWCSQSINIGIATGVDSCLAVLDVDPKNGGDKSLRQFNIPRTLEVITGSGGRHIYFKCPQGNEVRNSAGTLGDGLDTRADGGYVVAPPSLHSSGRQYRWKIDPRAIEPAGCPGFMLIRDNNSKTEQLSSDDPIPQGKRNSTLASLAGSMRRKGFSSKAILAALLEENKDRCNPELAESEVRKIAASIGKYQPQSNADGVFYDEKTGRVTLPNDHPDSFAEGFVLWSKVKQKLLYHYHYLDGWTVYENHRYHQIADEKEIENRIRRFIRRYCRISGKVPKRAHKTKSFVSNIMLWIRDMEGVHLEPDQKAPCSLDGRLDPGHTVALANGLLDVRDPNKPELVAFTPEFYTLNYLSFAYDPDATAPAWFDVLGQYFQDDQGRPDQLVPDILHSWIRKYLFRDTSHHKILSLIGRKRSGKGTIGRVIRELIGRKNVTNLSISSLCGDFGLEPLLNKQLGIMWDASVTGKNSSTNKAVEILKNISGEDGLCVNRKNKPQVDISRMDMSVMMIANKVLDLRDSTGALAGRMTFLQTTKSFYDREDPSVEPTLKGQLPGIFNLVIKAHRGEVLEHPKSKSLKREFEELSSPYIAFINDWCRIDSDSFVPCDVLWAFYVQWARLNNHMQVSPQKFKIEFNGVHDEVRRYRPQLTSEEIYCLKDEYNLDAVPGRGLKIAHRPHCYRGIDLKDQIKTSDFVWERPG